MSTDTKIDTKVKLAAWNRRGTNLQLIFSIARMECEEIIILEPLNVFDECLVKFKFALDDKCKLLSKISLKKTEKAKFKHIGVKITHADFEKQFVIPEEWINWMKMGASIAISDNETCTTSDKVVHPFLINLEVNIKVYVMTPKPLLVNQRLHALTATFTDFSLKAEDGLVAVHKPVLGACSDVFLAMLNREWKETTEGTFSIKGVTMQTLQHFKDYIYLQTVPDDFLQLQTLLLIANCYMIDNLKADCIAKLVELVTPENFDDLVEFACLNNVVDFMKAIVTDIPERIVKGIQEKNAYKQVSMEVIP